METAGNDGAIDAQRLKAYFHEVVKRADFYIAEEQKKIEEYEAIREKLKPLPEKLSHDIMVPFGSVAFMPGKLINTNCVTVNYGDHYFVERSVHETIEIIGRRIDILCKKIQGFEDEKKAVEERIGLVENFFNSDEPPEIREPYVEEEEKRKKALRKHEKKVVSDEDYQATMDRLTELEKLEENEEKNLEAEKQESSAVNEEDGIEVTETGEGMKTVKVDEVEYNIPKGVPVADFLTLLDHLNALEEHEDDEEEDDEEDQEEDDEASDGEKYSDHDSDEEEALDSDDYSQTDGESSAAERKRSVHFNLEDQPQSSSGEPPSPTATAKSILRNKERQSPIDHEAIERSNQRDIKKIVPSSQEAFPGMVVEHTPGERRLQAFEDEQQPSTSSEPPAPARVSKFKMQRMKR